MLSTHILAVGIPCIIALVAALRLTRRRVYPLPLPPGPRPLPFLGNALQLDSERPWLTYTAWGKTYGKIIHSRVLGIDFITINSETIARELLDKRSAIYSDRPVIRTNELSGLYFNTLLLPYGEALRRQRKIFHQVFRAEVSILYHDICSRYANELVINLLNATSDLQEETQAYTASLIMAVTYGRDTRGNGDSLLARANELLDIGRHVISPEKAAIFTAFPFLEKLPVWCFSGAFALMERSRELAQQLLNEPFNEVKAQMANGTASHSVVADFLSQADGNADEETMKEIALMAYMGGIDTTTSALRTFLLAMLLYPDVQARARAEINQVVGHDKMPCLDDRPSLPYLSAILREVLRWYPPAPLGSEWYMRHQMMIFTTGAVIVGNQWAMSRDEDTYPDASRFDPSRHLTVDGQLTDPFANLFVFGHGRRVCPGRWFAENTLWTAAAAVLAVLHVDHAKDSNGDRIEVKPEYTTGRAM
ncbi:cytochrome P450 [Suillus paluster]|uniref:cytochrome P450 n=1 Tax=Suillus paluster TaxID=48578 RepID=UPI001B87D29F|nr:cytochrome P450 [Suillus paluster]KAG1723718.1 cytochrome P450 [Suillus paluster]